MINYLFFKKILKNIYFFTVNIKFGLKEIPLTIKIKG